MTSNDRCNFFVSRILPVCVVLFLSGCSVPQMPLLPNTDELERASVEQFEDLTQEFAAQADELNSFRVLAAATVREGIQSIRGKQVVVFEQPDKLRVELFGTNLNQLLAFVVVAGNVVTAIDKEEGTAYIGSANRENMAALLSVPLAPSELMLLFAGRYRPPVNTDISQSELFFLPQDGRYLARYRISDGRVVTVTTEAFGEKPGVQHRLLFLSVQSESESDLVFHVKFNYDGEAETEQNVPSKLDLFFPDREIKLHLEYEKTWLNPDLSEKGERLFRIELPPGIPVVPLD